MKLSDINFLLASRLLQEENEPTKFKSKYELCIEGLDNGEISVDEIRDFLKNELIKTINKVAKIEKILTPENKRNRKYVFAPKDRNVDDEFAKVMHLVKDERMTIRQALAIQKWESNYFYKEISECQKRELKEARMMYSGKRKK